MAALDVIVTPSLDADSLLGLELHLLESVAARSAAPVMLIYATAGRAISIGRYHLYSGPDERSGINLYRRLTGGRVAGAGEGWVGLALILPTRTALLKNEVAVLKPDQVMNRYARGLLTGLRTLGVDCFYPGRDAITYQRRELAMCSYEINPSGAMLFEAMIAVNRGMEEVVHDLERIDPQGSLPCAMYGPENATKMVRELDHDLPFDQLARAIAAGYSESLAETQLRELTPAEIANGQHRGGALAASGWLNCLGDAASFTHKNRIASQLGSVEARLALASDGTIDRAMLTGDFIANSSAITELEGELRGKRFDLASISGAVTRTFSRGDNFMLGVGDLSNLVRLIAGAN